ncbi:MAG: hypothetical protein IPQ07_27890 [Myxococcales bacterium]|nr:hypothetical protein [Myxococcales bacterium]
MRDAVRSDDDLAIEAAKERLANLTTRPGYEEAMRTEPSGSKLARAISFGLAIGFVTLAVVSFRHVDATWLAWLLMLLFAGIALFSMFAGIGFSPGPAPEAMPVIVLGKRADSRPTPPLLYLELLRTDGSKIESQALEAVHAVLKAGDVGVAHVTPGAFTIVTAFHRL